MARVSGKCPACGQIIQVNDERESGHCGQCGAAIQVQECIQLLQSSGETASVAATSAQAAVDQDEVARRREERERAREAEMRLKEKQVEAELKAKAKREAEEAKIREQKRAEEAKLREQQRLQEEEEERISQIIDNMFQFCTTEQDFLQLRSKVLGMDCSESEKAKLLEELDFATQERLKDTIKKAKSWKESQESPMGTLVGCGVLLLICLFARKFFPAVATILAVLLVIGMVGIFVERFDKKKQAESKAAAELIDQYRQQGYKI